MISANIFGVRVIVISRNRGFQRRKLKPRNPLQVSVHSHRRTHHPLNLFFSFGPLLHDGFPFLVEIVLHGGKRFDDGFYALAEARAGFFASPGEFDFF